MNTSSQRFGKTKISLLRQQKGPEKSGTLSDTSLRSGRGELSLHREETNRKQTELRSEFKQVRAPQKCCHVTANFPPNIANKQLHITQTPSGKGVVPPPSHFSSTCRLSMPPPLEERRGAAVRRSSEASGHRPAPPQPPFTGLCG